MKRLKKLFLIAEVGSVHDGSFGNACKLIELSRECGASAVKFQLHDAPNETIKTAPNPKYFRSERRYDYFNRTAFNLNQLIKLKKLSNRIGLKFIVSPFSIESAEILNKINVDGFKIASGEVTNHPLLKKISSYKKNVYLSSGMSTYNEIDSAINILKTKNLTLMQCTSEYPCPVNKIGLNVLNKFKKYNCVLGLSDHSLGISGAVSFIANGASVIEKHITFSKKMYGSDAAHSMEPSDFKKFANEIKDAFTIYETKVDKNNIKYLTRMRNTFQKSIYAKYDLASGTSLNLQNISFKKPDLGISASMYKKIIGKKLNKKLKKDQKLSFKDLF